MNFGGPKPPEFPKDDLPPPQASGRYAAPPPCPRCELVKQQCTKTVINYQKSHRKKLEALRNDLKSARNRCEDLQRRVRRLSSIARVHIPSVLLGGLLGLGVQRLAQLLRRPRHGAQLATETAAAGGAQAEDCPVEEPVEGEGKAGLEQHVVMA